MERKDFLKKSLALCGLSMIPAAIIESCSKQSYAGPGNVNFTLDLTSSANAALNSVGGYILNSSGVIVIRTGASTYVALSTICTHQGCTVNYNKAGAQLVCPCHGGVYDTAGNVVSGPPPSPLTKYTITRSGNILTIKS